MAPNKHVFTSESVTEGHPDKVADQISDAVLDAILADDPDARVACETLVTTGMAVVAGEITTSTYVHIPDIVRQTVAAIGYTDASYGFDAQTCAVLTSIDRQSPDIAMGVDRQGAGDQGMMFGYATDETPERMPLPIMLAHRLAHRLSTVRKGNNGIEQVAWLRPDGKSQVSVEYVDDTPSRVATVVVSTQHAESVRGTVLGRRAIEEAVVEHVIRPVLRGGRLRLEEGALPHQSDRALRGRRPSRRRGTHRPQDHRRYLRGHGPSWRRRLQREGSVEGRPLGRLRRALGRPQHRGRRPGAALRGAGRLRHRCGGTGLGARPYLRDRQGAQRRARARRARGLRPDAARHHQGAQPALPDLPAHRRVRSLRTQGGAGARWAERRSASSPGRSRTGSMRCERLCDKS